MTMLMRRWVAANLGSSAWLLLAPAAPLAAAWLPHRGPKMLLDFHLRPLIRRLLPFLDPYVTVDISGRPDYSMDRIKSSDAYEEVKAYLSPACARDALELDADGAPDGDGFVLCPREGQEVSDEFRGVAVRWASVRPAGRQQGRDHRCLRLTFHRRHREFVVGEYLPHVRRRGRDAMFGNRRRRLYTNKKNIDYSSKVWSYIDFEHPTTFDTLAMHPEKKRRIMDDLDDFRSGREYYRRIGKAWKRGYLLYGPPGTGKSSMIAAMANYLNYDIYDIELTMVPTNNDLRKLFIETKGKSIIVIEDIDCSLDLTGHRSAGAGAGAGAANPAAQLAAGAKRKRTSEMTLSGLLNFIDGIWSAHSGERIIVFTTNHAERLDPALVRRGRMDMRVEMSYCCFEAFRTLARNYLGVDAHPLFGAVEELLRAVEITPADVAECLMMPRRTERGADVCLGRLIDELKKRAEEKNMERAEQKEAAASAAAPAKEANGGGEDMARGRRMVDPRTTIRSLRKGTEEGDDKAAAKPNGNEAMAADAGAIDLCDDDSSSDHGDKAKLEVDAQAEAAADGAEDNGDPSDAGDDDMDDDPSDAGDDDMDDYDDDMDDYEDDDDMDDYDEDDAIFDD